MNNLLRQDYIGQEGGALQYRSLVLEAFGVRPEAQTVIYNHSRVFWEGVNSYYPWRGWYNRDQVTTVPKPQEAQGSLHEFSHVWYDYKPFEHRRILAYQVAIYGFLPRQLGPILGCTPETMDFLKGYYDGVGTWAGMYDDDGGGPRPKVRVREFMGKGANPDLANIIIWEIWAGLVSYTMGRVSEGPRRLPSTMRWLFQDFFTGEVKATPYYLPGGVP